MLNLRAIARVFISLLIAAAPATAWADQPGVEIKGSLQSEQLTTRLSSEGIVTTYSDATGKPVRGFIARFADDKVWAIDFEHRTISEQTSAAAIENAQARLGRMLRSRTGGTQIDFRNQLATLTTLSGSMSIDGISLQGIGAQTANLKWRIWVAPGLPRLPDAIARKLPSLVPSTEASKALLGKIAGMPVVRTEASTPDGWKPVLEASQIRKVTVATSELSPPSGFRPLVIAAGHPTETQGMPPGGFDAPANAITGPGPIMAHPELYVVFWGPALNDPANAPARRALQGAVGEMSKPGYISFLGQYGIYFAKVNGVYSRPGSPPMSVGSTNFAEAAAMVYDIGFKEQAPIFWWVFGDHDPLYTLLVTRSEVDGGGWGGYHFVAFSLTHAVLPFPASLFAHDAIPFAVDKMSDGALVMPQNAVFDRATCRISPATMPPGVCNALTAFDDSTGIIAHELVEAASDPYPFFGWSDPGQQPAAQRSELADLCQQNTPAWMQDTVVGVTSVQTFWSNVHSSCVPDPRPTLDIIEPAIGQAFAASSGFVVVRGAAVDPAEGDISGRIQWSLDGASLGMGSNLVAHPAAGPHKLTALVMNTRGAMRTLDRNFDVVAKAPTVEIVAPPTAATFGTDQRLVLRGRAFEISPGDIPDSALGWTVDGTNAGSGPAVDWKATSEGTHVAILSATSPSGVTASATRQIIIGPATGKPSVIIRSPANGTEVEADASGTKSAPMQFAVEVTDGSGASVPALIIWRSDVDGVIGTGPTFSAQLSGARCSLFKHRITVTARMGKGKQSSDAINVGVGRVTC